MKNFFLGFLTVASIATADAQNPKTAITNAAMSLEMYDTDPSKTVELEKAKEDIDFAAGHEKTEGDPKVWRYRGKIYNRVAFDAKLKADNKDAGLIALESFNKSWDLEIAKLSEKGKPATKIPAKVDFKVGFESACRALYNGGADAYNGQNYELAYKSFMGILAIKSKTAEGLAKKPVNLVTTSKIDMEQEAARLGGMAAVQLGKPKEAEGLLAPLLDGKKIDEQYIPTTYSMLANAYQKAGDIKKASAILAKARKLYPTDQSLLIAEINIALSEGKLSELEDKLKQAVEVDKENVELHFVLGNVYDGIFREKLGAGDTAAQEFFDKAVAWYKKAAAINPQHFNAAYSLGALHVNYSNSFAKAMNDISDYKDPKLKELEGQYKEFLDAGLAHLLTAEEIKPDDLGVAVALREVYCRKGDENNCTKYGAKVKELQNSPTSSSKNSSNSSNNANSNASNKKAANTSGKTFKMEKDGEVYIIPVKLNGAAAIYFIFDTGASSISITPQMAMVLIDMKTIAPSDIGESAYAQIADGSFVGVTPLNIKKVEIAGVTLKNVKAVISSSSEAPYLLGMGAIKELGAVLDLEKGVLIFN